MKVPPFNINTLWADLLVEELIRLGVGGFVLSPGSRSSPLVAAVASRKGLERVVHFDERGAAFYALGRARAEGRPMVWITTSGTAAANGLPAVIEAAQSRVALILLTADRPPELRATGANQAINQVGLFGPYTRQQMDFPCPDLSIAPEFVLTSVAQLYYAATRAPAGPVHLNCMFREPLAPTDDGLSYAEYLDAIQEWLAGSAPYTRPVCAREKGAQEPIEHITSSLKRAKRGLVVLGQLDGSADVTAAVAALCETLGWPVLADITSNLRLGGKLSTSIPYYDLVLLSEVFCKAHPPDSVLHIGGALTSKRLNRLLHHARPFYVQLKDHPGRQDPDHIVRLSVEGDIAGVCQMLAEVLPKTAGTEWVEEWLAASSRVEVVLNQSLDQDSDISEPSIARLVSGAAPRDAGLFLASSMPIRDMDMYARPDGQAVRVAANRGASGIDGTLAAALGFASGLHVPTTAVLGDLAMLHDINSLALSAANRRDPFVAVVLNNHGGGIFSFLPIAAQADMFETYFGTPHSYSFEKAADMFGWAYHRPDSQRAFRLAYRGALDHRSPTLIEVTSDRDENLSFHRELEQSISDAVSD